MELSSWTSWETPEKKTTTKQNQKTPKTKKIHTQLQEINENLSRCRTIWPLDRKIVSEGNWNWSDGWVDGNCDSSGSKKRDFWIFPNFRTSGNREGILNIPEFLNLKEQRGNSEYFGISEPQNRWEEREKPRGSCQGLSQKMRWGLNSKSIQVTGSNHRDQGVKFLEGRCWQGCGNLLNFHKKHAYQKRIQDLSIKTTVLKTDRKSVV